MKPNRITAVLGVVAALLLVGTVVAALWPVKTDFKTSCGSFLASNDNVYENAYEKNMGMMGGAAFDVGAYTENSLGLPTGAFDVVARKMANEEVAKCEDARQTTGIVSGVLMVLTVVVGGVTVWLMMRGRSASAGSPRRPIE